MEKTNLLDFSNEILLQIFKHFNDVDLTNLAEVCKRFREVAKDTVAKKYNGESEDRYCDIRVYPGSGAENQEIYCRFFETFGNQIIALKIFPGADKNNHLLKLINQHCRFTKHITMWGTYDDSWNPVACRYEETNIVITETIRGMSELKTMRIDAMACMDFKWTEFVFPHLEYVKMSYVRNIKFEALDKFLSRNPHLQRLEVEKCMELRLKHMIGLKNHLNGLKTLKYDCEKNEVERECSDIIMENLENLDITANISSTANVLSAIGRGSKMIRNLVLRTEFSWDIDIDRSVREIKNCISLFEKLESLRVTGFKVGIELLRTIIRNVPSLTLLNCDCVDFGDVTTDNMLYLFTKGKQLKELKLDRDDLNSLLPMKMFDSYFHRKFAEIVRNRGSGIKLHMEQYNKRNPDKIIITEDKIIRNGQTLYCVGYDKNQELPIQTNIHLFDFGDKVLENIYDYLDKSAQRALYETCTQMKSALQERIKLQWFTVSDGKIARDLFNRFGEHITKLEIDMKTNDLSQMTETWKLISDNYSKQITEIIFKNIIVSATGNVPVEFPNLSRIQVHSIVSSDEYIFPLMECPKLTHLEFYKGKIILPSKASQFGISLNSLKMIRICGVGNIIEKILDRLDDETCDQIQELSLNYIFKKRKGQTAKIVMRFQNLTNLSHDDYGLEEGNFEYMFKSCTKLKILTIYVDYDTPPVWRRMLQAISDNCKDLEVLRLFGIEWHYFDPVIPDVADYLPNVTLKILCSKSNRYFVRSHFN